MVLFNWGPSSTSYILFLGGTSGDHQNTRRRAFEKLAMVIFLCVEDFMRICVEGGCGNISVLASKCEWIGIWDCFLVGRSECAVQ